MSVISSGPVGFVYQTEALKRLYWEMLSLGSLREHYLGRVRTGVKDVHGIHPGHGIYPFVQDYINIYLNVLKAFDLAFEGDEPTKTFDLPKFEELGPVDLRVNLAETMVSHLLEQEGMISYKDLDKHLTALYLPISELDRVGELVRMEGQVLALEASKIIVEKATGVSLKDAWLTLHVRRVHGILGEYGWREQNRFFRPNPIEILEDANILAQSVRSAFRTLYDYEDRLEIARFVYAYLPDKRVEKWLHEKIGGSLNPELQGALTVSSDGLGGALTEALPEKGRLTVFK